MQLSVQRTLEALSIIPIQSNTVNPETGLISTESCSSKSTLPLEPIEWVIT